MVNRIEIRKRILSFFFVFACIPLMIILCFVSSGNITLNKDICNSDVLLCYQERLRSVHTELEALIQQHTNLISHADKEGVNTKDMETSVMSIGKQSPTLMYEIQRRVIHTNIKDFWNYLKFALEGLVQDLGKGHQAKKIQIILEQANERKRSLLSDLQSLSKVDGYNEWRKNEAKEVSRLIQRRLHYLQNPSNFEKAKKVVCAIDACGFGCQLHHLVYCLIFAYATRRTMIINNVSWQYEKKGWYHAFEPVSNFSTVMSDERIMPWYIKKARVVALPELRSIDKQKRPKFLPPAIPRDLAERIEMFNGDPASWWIGQMVKFLFRPRKSFKESIAKSTKKINFTAPIVGVQIRRSDKITNNESKFYDLHDYMVHVKDYYDRRELSQNVDVRRVYLASDDPTAIKEAREKYPLYEFLGDQSFANVAAGKKRYTTEGVIGLLADLQLLTQCDYLVCTFSSNFCRLAYAMMQANRVDASKSIVSLDDIFSFWGSDKPSRITTIQHFPSADNPDEILIMVV